MRRIVLSFVLATAASLAACSGGGSVLNTGSSTAGYVRITPQFAGQGGGSGTTTTVFSVTQGKSITVKADAFGNGGGLVNTTFRWTAALVNSGAYNNAATGSQSACPTTVALYGFPLAAPPVALVPRNIGTADLSNNIAVQPEDSSVATFNAPAYAAIYPAPNAGTTYGSSATATTPPSYCVVISAIAANNAVGSVTAFALAP